MNFVAILALLLLPLKLFACTEGCPKLSDAEKIEKLSMCEINVSEMRNALYQNKGALELIGNYKGKQSDAELGAIKNSLLRLSEFGNPRIKTFQNCSAFLLAYEYVEFDSFQDRAIRGALNFYWSLLHISPQINKMGYKQPLHGFVLDHAYRKYAR